HRAPHGLAAGREGPDRAGEGNEQGTRPPRRRAADGARAGEARDTPAACEPLRRTGGSMSNWYEDKIERRRELYQERARKARGVSRSLQQTAYEMAAGIPLGQPILVGHHSERRDRRFREKIHNTFRKAWDAAE